MSDWLTWQDLFTFGLGSDIAGAWLLAKGLLLTPRDIRRMDSHVGETILSRTNALIDDKVAGQFGRGGLLLGFAAQIIGYVIIVSTDAAAKPAAGRAVGALLATLVGTAIVALAYLCSRERFVRRESISVAKHTPQGELADRPDGLLLHNLYTERYGEQRRYQDGEGFADFLRRSKWRVEDATEPPPSV